MIEEGMFHGVSMNVASSQVYKGKKPVDGISTSP
jgi:hypothetical protein